MFINPNYECGVKITPVINPMCGGMNLPCPDVSKKALTLVCKSHNKNMLINPNYMSVESKYPQTLTPSVVE